MIAKDMNVERSLMQKGILLKYFKYQQREKGVSVSMKHCESSGTLPLSTSSSCTPNLTLGGSAASKLLTAVGERQQKGCDETNNPDNVYMRVMQVLTVQVMAGVPYLVFGISSGAFRMLHSRHKRQEYSKMKHVKTQKELFRGLQFQC